MVVGSPMAGSYALVRDWWYGRRRAPHRQARRGHHHDDPRPAGEAQRARPRRDGGADRCLRGDRRHRCAGRRARRQRPGVLRRSQLRRHGRRRLRRDAASVRRVHADDGAVQSIPQPVCAKVHALATAAGCQLVATCDLAVAAESAGFAIPGGKGGLFCHTPLVAVARNIGRKRALEMAFTGDRIDAATAADWGLINRAVPDAELDSAVDDLMARATRVRSPRSRSASARSTSRSTSTRAPAYEYAVNVMAAAARHARRPRGHRRLPREAQGDLSLG